MAKEYRGESLSRRFDRDLREQPVYDARRDENDPIRKKWVNDHEAHALLDLIVMEFKTDPMSVQCFDLRIVERAKRCVEERARIVRETPGFGEKV